MLDARFMVLLLLLLLLLLLFMVLFVYDSLGTTEWNWNRGLSADLGGGCRGCAHPPPPREMSCGFLENYVVCWC